MKGYVSPKDTKKGWEGPDIVPEVRLTAKDLPAIKDWAVGQSYCLEMTVKLVGLHQDSYDKTMNGTFEIKDVKECQEDTEDD